MIIQTKTGTKITGTLSRDPNLKGNEDRKAVPQLERQGS